MLIGRIDPGNERIQDCCLVRGGPKAFEVGTTPRKPRQWHFAAGPVPLLEIVLGSVPAPAEGQNGRVTPVPGRHGLKL